MTDYARIGVGYAAHRVADARIEAQIHAALGDARTVVNVGAGTGNYEPRDRDVIAVEPAPTMLAQRAPDAAPALRAFAEALPFGDGSFDVAMGVLTVHHWTDRERGVAEMARVGRRVVVLCFESGMTDGLWLFDYWPAIHELTSERVPPGEEFFRTHLDVASIVAVPIAADCTDGFAGAFWCRPEAYLDRRQTAGMSSFAQLDDDTFARGADRLRADLESGAWDARYGRLRSMHEIDLGYRIVSGRAPGPK